MLLRLAGTGALAAAILLPLYYLMDATITLLRRLARREVWEAHRSHFYQKATDNGFSALEVSAHVFGLNLVLAGLAAMTLLWPSGVVQIAALAAGVVLVGLVLRRFARPRIPEVSDECPLIALTGATGFIGRHLLASCRSAATGSRCCCGARPRCPPARRAP